MGSRRGSANNTTDDGGSPVESDSESTGSHDSGGNENSDETASYHLQEYSVTAEENKANENQLDDSISADNQAQTSQNDVSPDVIIEPQKTENFSVTNEGDNGTQGTVKSTHEGISATEDPSDSVNVNPPQLSEDDATLAGAIDKPESNESEVSSSTADTTNATNSDGLKSQVAEMKPVCLPNRQVLNDSSTNTDVRASNSLDSTTPEKTSDHQNDEIQHCDADSISSSASTVTVTHDNFGIIQGGQVHGKRPHEGLHLTLESSDTASVPDQDTLLTPDDNPKREKSIDRHFEDLRVTSKRIRRCASESNHNDCTIHSQKNLQSDTANHLPSMDGASGTEENASISGTSSKRRFSFDNSNNCSPSRKQGKSSDSPNRSKSNECFGAVVSTAVEKSNDTYVSFSKQNSFPITDPMNHSWHKVCLELQKVDINDLQTNEPETSEDQTTETVSEVSPNETFPNEASESAESSCETSDLLTQTLSRFKIGNHLNTKPERNKPNVWSWTFAVELENFEKLQETETQIYIGIGIHFVYGNQRPAEFKFYPVTRMQIRTEDWQLICNVNIPDDAREDHKYFFTGCYICPTSEKKQKFSEVVARASLCDENKVTIDGSFNSHKDWGVVQFQNFKTRKGPLKAKENERKTAKRTGDNGSKETEQARDMPKQKRENCDQTTETVSEASPNETFPNEASESAESSCETSDLLTQTLSRFKIGNHLNTKPERNKPNVWSWTFAVELENFEKLQETETQIYIGIGIHFVYGNQRPAEFKFYPVTRMQIRTEDWQLICNVNIPDDAREDHKYFFTGCYICPTSEKKQKFSEVVARASLCDENKVTIDGSFNSHKDWGVVQFQNFKTRKGPLKAKENERKTAKRTGDNGSKETEQARDMPKQERENCDSSHEEPYEHVDAQSVQSLEVSGTESETRIFPFRELLGNQSYKKSPGGENVILLNALFGRDLYSLKCQRLLVCVTTSLDDFDRVIPGHIVSWFQDCVWIRFHVPNVRRESLVQYKYCAVENLTHQATSSRMWETLHKPGKVNRVISEYIFQSGPKVKFDGLIKFAGKKGEAKKGFFRQMLPKWLLKFEKGDMEFYQAQNMQHSSFIPLESSTFLLRI